MKKTMLGLCAATAVAFGGSADAGLIITGIIDGGLTGGTPKAIEVFATTTTDLSTYSVDGANNGGAFDSGSAFALSGTATAGSFFYIASEAPQFTSYFGFAPTFTTSQLNVNGDDVVGLFDGATLVDVYGVLGTDGTGEPWEYLDGYAYRVDETGPNPTFTLSEWTISDLDATDGTTTAAGAGFPFGTYQPIPEPASLVLVGLGGLAMLGRGRRQA